MKIGLYGARFQDDLVRRLAGEIKSLGAECALVKEGEVDEARACRALYILPHRNAIDYAGIMRSVPTINSPESEYRAMNKIRTTELLARSGIPQPSYVITGDVSVIQGFTKNKGQAIIKHPLGRAGAGHYVLTSDGSLVAHRGAESYPVVDAHDHLIIGDARCFPPYLVQEFISEAGADTNDRVYRVYVVGNRAQFATARIRDGVNTPGDSIINIARGARYEFVPLEDLMAGIALMVADVIGYDIGVVDMLKDKHGKPLVIETDCDGRFAIVDRKFVELPEYDAAHNFERMIGERLIEIANGAPYRRQR